MTTDERSESGAGSTGGQAAGRRTPERPRKPSVRRIAEASGVSVATVSRVLNNHPDVRESTRKRVIDAARSSGYVPNVVKRSENTIALFYPRERFSADFGGFESQIVAGILSAANDLNFDVSVLGADHDKHPLESYARYLHRKGVRGAIVRAKGAAEAAVEIAAEGFPSIVIAERSDDPRVSFVDAESRTTSRQAIEHLLSFGHRRIAVATQVLLDSDHRDRLDGYLDVLRAAGIGEDRSLVVQGPSDQQGGVRMLHELLQRPDPPTAVYFTSPLATVGALHRCAELGIRVPRDLSIVGFDEEQIRLRTFPRYTAVCQDARRIAVEATNWLISSVQQEQPTRPYRVVHETAFRIEASTGPAPAVPLRIGTSGDVVRA